MKNKNKSQKTISKAISILQQKEKFPVLVRYKIDALENAFLEGVETAICDLLCNRNNTADRISRVTSRNHNIDAYGLDSDRDTEAEVAHAIATCPRVLRKKIQHAFEGYRYPIAVQLNNPKAVSFVPLLAKLGIEFGNFKKEERGGIFDADFPGPNILSELVENTAWQLGRRIRRKLVVGSNSSDNDGEDDDPFLEVLLRMKAMDLFKKNDIRDYGLVMKLCNRARIPEKPFRFLTDWDPLSLTTRNNNKTNSTSLPLHHAAWTGSKRQCGMVLEAGLRHFPACEGILLLFQKDSTGSTPFHYACERIGVKSTMKVIDNTMQKVRKDGCLECSFKSIQAVLMASTCENIHLDGLYFLLRRQPNLLLHEYHHHYWRPAERAVSHAYIRRC
ncbi:unnamed protein product [Pseudo-nitzschia multistriata]|uniref:Uncharacterized protein n=1 Tax=Pseudo-nitzschia multistriata TaxID=183589 RepID=A0A448ZBE8_9STRA|nr:unnamed protein product [Pseudo-nitzschia multistriata]